MKISSYLAMVLIGSDLEDLSKEELDAVNKIDFDFTITDYAEESNDINGICEITGLWSHCVTIEGI